jgi:hypothetical protein
MIERTFDSGLLVREVEYQLDEQPGGSHIGSIVKSVDEQRFLLSVAYPAMKAENNMAKDGYRDYAPADVVELGAWRFMLKGAELGMWHQDGYDHCAHVVESYIYRNPIPWEIESADGSVQTICKGDWLVGTLLEPPTWALYKSGLIGGLSPQGRAARKAAPPDQVARLRSS